MREKCIYCGTLFTKENNSDEHLIPEGIGGKLSRKFLLCKNCNNKILSKFDAALQEHLALFLSLKGIEGKRNKKVSAKGESNFGKIQFKDGRPIVKGYVIDNPNGTRTIQGDKKYTDEILEGLKKKYPNLKVIKREPKVLNLIQLKLIGQNVWKGIGKILYLFAHYFDEGYISKTEIFKKFLSQPDDIVPFECPIGWVSKNIEKSLILPEEINHYPFDCIFTITDYRVEEKCIIGYVSFFGIRYIGLVDDNYEGDSKVLGCYINVKSKVSGEFCCTKKLNITRKILTEIIDKGLILDSLELLREQYSQAFQNAKLSKDIEDVFSSVAKEIGLNEGDLADEEFFIKFFNKFINSDSMKNILTRNHKPNNKENLKS